MTRQGIWLGVLLRIEELKARQDDAQRNSGDATLAHSKPKRLDRVSRAIHVFQVKRRSHKVVPGQEFIVSANPQPSCEDQKIWMKRETKALQQPLKRGPLNSHLHILNSFPRNGIKSQNVLLSNAVLNNKYIAGFGISSVNHHESGNGLKAVNIMSLGAHLKVAASCSMATSTHVDGSYSLRQSVP